MKVMDNNLFEVSPRKGRLLPGESTAVTFTYQHVMVGTDRLPVLFKLSSGREILVSQRRQLHLEGGFGITLSRDGQVIT